jgi:hypothetical protein
MRSQHLRGVLSGFFGQDICFQCFSEGGGLQNPLPIGLRRRFLSAEGLEPRPSHLFHCFPFQLFNSSGDFDISYAVCSPRERAQIYCAPKGEITCKSGGAFLSFVLLGLGGKWEVTGVDRNGGREVAHHHWRSAHPSISIMRHVAAFLEWVAARSTITILRAFPSFKRETWGT